MKYRPHYTVTFCNFAFLPFYRAMHCVLRGIATVNPSSSVCPSVMLMYRGHISSVSFKVTTQLVSLGSSLIGAPTPFLAM